MEEAPAAPWWGTAPALLVLIGLVVLLSAAWAQRPDGRLRIWLLDTPGDAALLRTPGGAHILIDGGGDPAQLALLLGRHMPYWQRDLALVVLTRPDAARLPGQVAALARYRPALALAPPDLGARGAAGEWRRLIVEQGVPARRLAAGQQLTIDGVRLQVLGFNPGDDGGAVLLVRYGATQVLFHTGGPAGDDLARSIAGGPLAALVYPWQRELETPLVLALRPQATIFTRAYAAAEPALLTYADRRRLSPQLFHPQNDGTIALTSDGRRVVIEGEGGR